MAIETGTHHIPESYIAELQKVLERHDYQRLADLYVFLRFRSSPAQAISVIELIIWDLPETDYEIPDLLRDIMASDQMERAEL